MNDKCVVYDFETFSTDTSTGAVISMAVLEYDESKFITKQPYQFEELVDAAVFIKFDVEEQVRRYGRKIDEKTLGWWSRQSPEAQNGIKPSPQDISIAKLPEILYDQLKIQKNKWQYARGISFDGGFLKSILNEVGHDCPHNLYNARDTRSLIAGLTWGSDVKNGFFPEGVDKNKFIAHDPCHDVALDVMRIQYLSRTILMEDPTLPHPVFGDDDIPF